MVQDVNKYFTNQLIYNRNCLSNLINLCKIREKYRYFLFTFDQLAWKYYVILKGSKHTKTIYIYIYKLTKTIPNAILKN